MKVLFVTGNEECECKGTGMIERLMASVDPKNSAQPLVQIKARMLCDCVEAKELQAAVDTKDV